MPVCIPGFSVCHLLNKQCFSFCRRWGQTCLTDPQTNKLTTMAHQPESTSNYSSTGTSDAAASLDQQGQLPSSSMIDDGVVASCAIECHPCLGHVEIPTEELRTRDKDTLTRPTQQIGLLNESTITDGTIFSETNSLLSTTRLLKDLKTNYADRMSGGDSLTNSMGHASNSFAEPSVTQHDPVKSSEPTETTATSDVAEQIKDSVSVTMVVASAVLTEVADVAANDVNVLDSSACQDDHLSISDESHTPEQENSENRKKSRSSCLGSSTGRWTESEHQAFLHGLSSFGREWKKVATLIPTRTSAQVRSHAQKYFHKMQRDQQEPPTHAIQPESAPTAADSVTMLDTDPPLSTTVRAEATRILAHPESVQQEVEETLHRLRQRYRNLQERLRRVQERKQREDDVSLLSVSGVSQDLSPSVSVSSLQNEELIALRVLQGGLDSSSRDSTPSYEVDAEHGVCEDNAHQAQLDESNATSEPSAKRPRNDSNR